MKYNRRIITFIGPLPPPFGGVSVINASFQRLNYRNLTVDCFNTSHGGFQEDLYKGFPWQRFLISLKKIIQLHHHLIKIKPEIVNIFITSGFAILRDIVIIRIVKWERIPCIVHFHSKKQGEFVLKESRLRKLAKFLNKNVDKIVLLSQDHFDFFTNYFNKRKCTVIENFVEYKWFNCSIQDKGNTLLFVGRLSKEKGFLDLLDAVHELKRSNFHILIDVIGTAANYKDQIRIDEIIKEYDIASYFVFHGVKSGSEKYNLFKNARCLVFPSYFENSPIVLKEAIAANMGIIASNIEANKLILDGIGNTMWHDARNSQSLAQAIRGYLMADDHGLSLCKASSKVKQYDAKFAEKKINAIINELYN